MPVMLEARAGSAVGLSKGTAGGMKAWTATTSMAKVMPLNMERLANLFGGEV